MNLLVRCLSTRSHSVHVVLTIMVVVFFMSPMEAIAQVSPNDLNSYVERLAVWTADELKNNRTPSAENMNDWWKDNQAPRTRLSSEDIRLLSIAFEKKLRNSLTADDHARDPTLSTKITNAVAAFKRFLNDNFEDNF